MKVEASVGTAPVGIPNVIADNGGILYLPVPEGAGPVGAAVVPVAPPVPVVVPVGAAPPAGEDCRLWRWAWPLGPWALTSSTESEAAKRADSAEMGSMVGAVS